ncbi:hypothetical protein G6F56_010402 [Rhizopus delemar]|nr:hypothetical protein G6F56_010402 [Rhizopus delemar]
MSAWQQFDKRFNPRAFFSFRPTLKPFLSYRNELRRKIWMNDKINWTVNDWSKVIWSDEFRFALRHNDGGEHGHDFIFQEYGASCHTGGYARWWKNKACTKGFDFWPAQSPDLNPIENLWYVLVKRIGRHRRQANHLEGLKVIIYEEWANLDHDIYVKLCRNILEDVMPLKEH